MTGPLSKMTPFIRLRDKTNERGHFFEKTNYSTYTMLFPMFATVCLLANWISIKHGLPIGIIGVFVLILALELIAILNFDSSMNMILNPLCFNIDIIQSVEIALAKILSELVYLAILSIGITLYICRTDIF